MCVVTKAWICLIWLEFLIKRWRSWRRNSEECGGIYRKQVTSCLEPASCNVEIETGCLIHLTTQLITERGDEIELS